MKDVLSELKEVLEHASVLADEVARKQEAVTTQEAETLTRLIELVQPILPAVGEKIPVAAHHSGHQLHNWRYEYLKRPGLVLVDGFDREYTDRDWRGEYTGSRLVLTADGLLDILRYGRWSAVQGEVSFWNSDEKPLTPRQAVETYDFADIVSGLAREIKASAEKQERRAQELEERLKVLQQVQAALKGSG